MNLRIPIHKRILSGFIIMMCLSLTLGITNLVLLGFLRSNEEGLIEFQDDVADFSDILSKHYNWRNGLIESVLLEEPFTGSLDPNTCALGTWMNGDRIKDVTDPEILKSLERIQAPHNFIHAHGGVILEILETGDQDAALAELTDVVFPKFAEVIAELNNITERYHELMDVKVRQAKTLEVITNIIGISLLVVVIGIGILLTKQIIKAVEMPLNEVAVSAEALAQGDLALIPEYDLNDQIGRLVNSFKHLAAETDKQIKFMETLAESDFSAELAARGDKDNMNIAIMEMLAKLNQRFGQIREISENVAQEATNIKHEIKGVADGAGVLAAGAADQEQAVIKLKSSVDEVTEKIEENTACSAASMDNVTATTELINKSMDSMGKMVESMESIAESSNRIINVISVINDIAAQTNLLALNASIEAARAGEAGRGFAVVADEVGKLALMSSEAAKETTGLIKDSALQVEKGLQIMKVTNEDLQAVNAKAQDTIGISREMAGLLESQGASVKGINLALERISEVVQVNSATAEEFVASTEEISGASDEMSEQAVSLKEVIEKFKLKQ